MVGLVKRAFRTMVTASMAIAAMVVGGLVDGSPPVGAVAPREHRVMLVTDSVGLGVRGVLDEFFPADWDVSIVGEPARFVEQLESNFVRPNLFRTGDHVVIAGGYNYPYWDAARFERSVDSIVNTLTDAGVKHVYWVTLRDVKPQYISASAWRQVQPYYWYFPTVNEHLERALARHPNLTLVDWAAAADRPGVTYDAIHLNRPGAELYSSLIARAVRDNATRPPNDGITRVRVATPAQVASGDVAAAAINLTSVRGRTTGFLSAAPCEQEPGRSSNLNHRRDQVIAASAIVPVGPSGEICVYNKQAGHVVVDAFGTFGADAHLIDGDPVRVLDTRSPAGNARQPGNIERRVAAVNTSRAGGAELDRTVALNVTVLQAAGKGFATVHECGVAPTDTSNVNFLATAAAPNLVITQADSSGDICVTATQDAHLIVDVLGVFGPDSTVATSAPSRLVDTRGGAGPVAGQVVEIQVPVPQSTEDDDASPDDGIVANLTIVRAQANGYATAYPCAAGRPATSNINYVGGATIANAVVIEPDVNGKVCVFTSQPAEVLFDLMARTGIGFDGITPTRFSDSRS